MTVLILAIGSRGDVQPYAALGQGLRRAGHDVVLATSPRFRAMVEEHGVGWAYLSDDLVALVESPDGRGAFEDMGSLVSGVRAARRLFRRAEAIQHDLVRDGWTAARDVRPDVIVFHPKMFAGAHYAEALGVPAVLAAVFPQLVPTATLPGVGFPDWPPGVAATGFWFLDDDDAWTPPPALEAFLAAGEAPVYVGFGSMAGRDPARTARVVVEALARAGVRGILAPGWGGLAAGDLSPDVFALDEAPHAWLFPRVAAVVHHGGAGTTAAGLRAGPAEAPDGGAARGGGPRGHDERRDPPAREVARRGDPAGGRDRRGGAADRGDPRRPRGRRVLKRCELAASPPRLR